MKYKKHFFKAPINLQYPIVWQIQNSIKFQFCQFRSFKGLILKSYCHIMICSISQIPEIKSLDSVIYSNLNFKDFFLKSVSDRNFIWNFGLSFAHLATNQPTCLLLLTAKSKLQLLLLLTRLLINTFIIVHYLETKEY